MRERVSKCVRERGREGERDEQNRNAVRALTVIVNNYYNKTN